MIHFPRSKFGRVFEMALASLSSHGVTGGGQPLMQVMENGVAKAKRHDGTASKPVIGFSVMKAGPETALSTAQTFVPTADNLTGTLKYTPVGTVTAFNTTDNSSVVVDTSAASGQIGVNGTAVTFHSSMAGKRITVVYNFSPTIAQLRMIQGDQEPGGAVQLAIGSISVMKEGILYTSAFEANEAWFNFNDTSSWLVVNSGGVVGVGNSTEPRIPNAQLLQAPTGDVPFVGFSFAC